VHRKKKKKNKIVTAISAKKERRGVILSMAELSRMKRERGGTPEKEGR